MAECYWENINTPYWEKREEGVKQGKDGEKEGYIEEGDEGRRIACLEGEK